MNRHFYNRIALMNLKKNAKLYIPYVLACIGTIMMFYILLFITDSSYTKSSSSLFSVMFLGSIVVGIFSIILLFYANSFLIRQRKKEIGLYNILGMEKKHIGRVLAIENIYISVVSIGLGIGLGLLFSKLLMLILAKALEFNISYTFEYSLKGLAITIVFYVIIFTLILISNLRQIHIANPIELLRGSKVGEREPKSKWILTLVGVTALAGGYTIALTVESAIEAIGLFFIAVILVIIGTYCLFISGSIVILKILRKNKGYYYKPNHFTAISGLMYRMKQNAVGLANICILSTMVLVMISGTTCLFIGFEDAMREQYPRNISITGNVVDEASESKIKEGIDEFYTNSDYEVNNYISYRYITCAMKITGSTLVADSSVLGDTTYLFTTLITQYELYKLTGVKINLQSGETAYVSEDIRFNTETVSIQGVSLKITERLDLENELSFFDEHYVNCCVFVVADENEISRIYTAVYDKSMEGMLLYTGYDTNAKGEDQIALTDEVYKYVLDKGELHFESLRTTCVASARDVYLTLYGGLFFLGVFLGTLFVMATVLIMYYKQISEGYDDKERFEIMQKVGMSREEVKKNIHSQVILVFFLPLVTAIIHLAFAFKMITKMLLILGITNVTLFICCTICTILAFAIIYAVVYGITAKSYYRIVKREV